MAAGLHAYTLTAEQHHVRADCLQVLQAAICHAVVEGMPCYTHVTEVVVAELPNSVVQHAAYVRFLLDSIAPEATVTELHLRRMPV
jgi:hypothetical protein